MSTDEPPDGSAEEQPPEQQGEHDASGLDVARAAARAARGGPSAVPRRRRGRPRDAADEPSRAAPGRAGSGARPSEHDPQPMDLTVARLVDREGWADDLRVHGVFARWAEIVGSEVAAHSRPEAYVDGRVTVGADSTAWATQLRLLAPALVRRLNEELGHGSVTVIEVRGPNLPSWTRGRRSVRGARGPRDTYG